MDDPDLTRTERQDEHEALIDAIETAGITDEQWENVYVILTEIVDNSSLAGRTMQNAGQTGDE